MQTLISMRDGTGAPSKKLSLTETAYQALRARVLSGELRPGAEFSESELADQLSMSKTPVREALGRLVAEGLIEAFPRRGYRVTPVTVKDINDLFAIRAMTEGTAASMAALNLTPADLDRLETLAEARYDPSQGESVQSFLKANRDFHIAIAEGANNPRLLAMVAAFLDECTRLFYLGALSRDVNPETSNDHRHIVGVLRLRDPEQARAAMVEHSEHTQQGILKALISSNTTALTI
ncbi:GntR family transcriptional regulator [Microvirga sp. BT689]|uniref:GntR family transcriptional regulator n=1 Tax=Microvirga arvi TaxID=2778731 RepID=UPI00195096A5|nr:GntR family transcriptional regulator [Microvirga arvi]MBM6581314.1 GntR family transcriptional regulator [Microvirga arvi]